MAPKRKGSSKASSSKTDEEDTNINGSNNSKKPCLEEEDIKSEKSAMNKIWNRKIISWNVDGIRAWLKKDGKAILKKEKPDVVCLQETKCSLKKMPNEVTNIDGYKSYFFSAQKEGYAGVAMFCKTEPLSISNGIGDETHDDEGRCITAEFDQFYLVTSYVPNSGRKLVTLDKRMDWDLKLKEHLAKLDAKKPVVYCGDLNVAHKEIDLKNPKTNKRNAGFTQEERDNFTDLLKAGFVDSFRHFYPDLEGQYTFWTYMMNCRAKNVGWRLDYFVVSERLMPKISDNVIGSSYLGSDHCPITLLMNL